MRLGVAALGSMQAMMYATGIYFGAFSGMEVQYRDYFRFISLIVTTPIFFYQPLKNTEGDEGFCDIRDSLKTRSEIIFKLYKA